MSTPLTLERLAEIEERANAATPGPWFAEYSGEQGDCVVPADAESTREAVCLTRLYDATADADFIAHARSDVPDLLAEVETSHRACQTLGAIVDRQGIDICRIAGVEMPEDGDADFELAWSIVAGMRAEIDRLTPRVITTTEEMTALPHRTVLMAPDGTVITWSWRLPTNLRELATQWMALHGSLTVVWTPPTGGGVS